MKQLCEMFLRHRGLCKASIGLLPTIVVALAMTFVGCESLDDSIGSDPYGGGKPALGIKLLSTPPIPASGAPGDTILFRAEKLLKWCDPTTGRYDFKMYMGEEPAEIITATDTTLTVRVPQELSTGITYLVLNNQVFYGPTFNVIGNLSVDREFGLYKDQSQFTGAIYDAVESKQKGQAGTFYLVGDMKYNVDKWNVCRGIALLNTDGNLTTASNNYFRSQRGTVVSMLDGNRAYVRSIALTKDNRMVVAGVFSNFFASFTNEQKVYMRGNNYLYANNMALLAPNALIDTVQHTFSEAYDGNKYIPLPIPSFNGGFKQEVLKCFVTNADKVTEQKVIAIGLFTQYSTTEYKNSYYNSDEKLTTVTAICRMNIDGSIDTAYRSAANHVGPNGRITDGYMDEDNGVVLIGEFTSFDGKPAKGIVRLDADGNVDQAYMNNIAGGFNAAATKVRYNADTQSAIFVGRFTAVGNHQTQYIAKIGKDGVIDQSFKVSGFEGGVPTFGCMVSKQQPKIIVSGTFTSFKGIHRRGFLVLDPDGRVTQKFNVPGAFEGEIYQLKETETAHGEYGILLVGNFTKFNGERVNNAVMLQADFK